MRVSGIRADGSVLEAAVEWAGGPPRRVEWRLPDGMAPDVSGTPALAATLPLAMRVGEALDIDAPVSPRLLAATERIQDVVLSFDRHLNYREPRLQRVPVRAAGGTTSDLRSTGRGAATFFTGGVDSFYTAVRHRDELAALVYVHGFDIRLGATELRRRVAPRLRSAADGLGIPLVEIETNLRDISDGMMRWEDYHGAALASIALALAPHVDAVYVPATYGYATLVPLGSHPVLDPLWSSEGVEVVHDGAEADRVQKLALLAEEDAARRHLRVCWQNRSGAYNCGDCEKCLRTMIAMRIAGAADRFETFPPLDLRRVASRSLGGKRGLHVRDLLHLVTADGRDADLHHAMRRALRPKPMRDAAVRALASARARLGGRR